MSDHKPIIIGSHVSMKSPTYLVGSVMESVNNKANAMMIFVGAPQTTMRRDVNELKISEFHEALIDHNISLDNVFVHAPYLINLGNTLKPATFKLGFDFLSKEIKRCADIGLKTIILHPGASLGEDPYKSLDQIILALDMIFENQKDVRVALETMSGKGSEVGVNFDQLAYVLNKIQNPEMLGICWDTCHLFDAGYDLVNNLDAVIDEFETKVGLDKLWVMHLNDSKNGLSSHKDRHANIGKGFLGLEAIIKIVYHPKLINVPKILETPWETNTSPYPEEIALIRSLDPRGK